MCERPDCFFTHTTPRSNAVGGPMVPQALDEFGHPIPARRPAPLDEYGHPLPNRRAPMRDPMMDPMLRRPAPDPGLIRYIEEVASDAASRALGRRPPPGGLHGREDPMMADPYAHGRPGPGGRMMPVMRPRGPPTMGLAAAHELEEFDSRNPKDTRCYEFPNCHLHDDCPFFHPQIECKVFPGCIDNCNNRHPLCKFDEACEKEYCKFSHTADELYRAWKTGEPVRKPLITKKKEKCKFYPKCEKQNCVYDHPGQDNKVNKNKPGAQVGIPVQTDGKMNCPRGENCPLMKDYAHILKYNHWKGAQKAAPVKQLMSVGANRGRPQYSAPTSNPMRGRGRGMARGMNGSRYPDSGIHDPYSNGYGSGDGRERLSAVGSRGGMSAMRAHPGSYMDQSQDTQFSEDDWYRGANEDSYGDPYGAGRGRHSANGGDSYGDPYGSGRGRQHLNGGDGRSYGHLDAYVANVKSHPASRGSMRGRPGPYGKKPRGKAPLPEWY